MAGSLSDQLLKLGLVDDKAVKKAQHDQRQSNKKKGRKGVAQSREDRNKHFEAQRQESRRSDQARERTRLDGRRRLSDGDDRLVLASRPSAGRCQRLLSGRQQFELVVGGHFNHGHSVFDQQFAWRAGFQ